MVGIVEIPIENINEFWNIHFRYLVEDGIIEPEDYGYFSGSDYRDIIKSHMEREKDKHYMVYFVKDGVKIGASQYCTYWSEDGKCFILDFWVFEEYRNKGLGKECFYALEEHTKRDGAMYYELNSQKEASRRFWERLGFMDNGKDEYDMPLMIRR